MSARAPREPRFVHLRSGRRLAFWSWGGADNVGAPPPSRTLVCLHGGMGLDSYYLRASCLPSLADRNRRVIIFDQAGHGRSDREPDERYSHARWVRDLQELAAELAPGSFDLFGHSYGGFLAIDFALAHPEHVRRLILCGTSAGPVQVNLKPRSITADADLKRIFETLWPTFFPGPNQYNDVLGQIRYSHKPFRDAFQNELPRFDRRARIAELAMPVLLLCGSEDRYAAAMRLLYAQLPDAQHAELAGSGHMPFLDDADQARRVMQSFLNDNERRSP